MSWLPRRLTETPFMIAAISTAYQLPLGTPRVGTRVASFVPVLVHPPMAPLNAVQIDLQGRACYEITRLKPGTYLP